MKFLNHGRIFSSLGDLTHNYFNIVHGEKLADKNKKLVKMIANNNNYNNNAGKPQLKAQKSKNNY